MIWSWSKQILSTIVIILSLKAETEPPSEDDYSRGIKNYKKNMKKRGKMPKKRMGKETRKQKSKKRAKV